MPDMVKQFEHIRPGDQLIIKDHRGQRIIITGKERNRGQTAIALIIAAVAGALVSSTLGFLLSLFN